VGFDLGLKGDRHSFDTSHQSGKSYFHFFNSPVKNINLDSLRALRTGEEEHISEKEKSEGRLLAIDITFDDSPPENYV